MSLRVYGGEYMVSPVPVHFGMNKCSHACWYCFSNLNNPNRICDTKDLKKIANVNGYRGLANWYMQKGYPVLACNDTDPCAKTNEHAVNAFLDAVEYSGVRVFWQTKGGNDDVIKRIIEGQKTTIYITLTGDKATGEYGAPSHTERVMLCERMREAGHHVVLGINPVIPEWWSDFTMFLKDMKSKGFTHIWTGYLHLNYKQLRNMPQTLKDKYGDIISKYSNKTFTADEQRMIDCMTGMGFNVFDETSSMGGFWDRTREIYNGKILKTLDDFLSDFKRTYGDTPVAFGFDYFTKYFDIEDAPKSADYARYIQNIGRSIRNSNEIEIARSFRDVHRFLWRILDYPSKLMRNDFCLLSEGKTIICDDNDRDYMVYVPHGHDSLTFDIDNVAVVLS